MSSASASGPSGLTIAVAAGKGGTGKTLVATSIALALSKSRPGQVQLVDCDVEEPNADLLLPTIFDSSETVTILVPEVDSETCIKCGKCAEVCQASAIAKVREAVITFHELCTGCGSCAYICPVDAIAEIPREVGQVDRGTAADDIEFIQGRSRIAQQHTGSVTGAAKAHIDRSRIAIVDAPPGTSCPMQETVDNSDYCILVTEPTPFGLSDLGVAVDTCRTLQIPCGVVINRDGVGDLGVEEYCVREEIPILLRIPHKREIAEAYSEGRTLSLAFPEWNEAMLDVVKQIVEEVAS